MPFMERDRRETDLEKRMMFYKKWGVVSLTLDVLKYFTYGHKRW